MAQNLIEPQMMDDRPVVNSVQELFMHASLKDYLITLVIVLCAYGLTWGTRKWFRARDLSHNRPNWFDVGMLSRILWPLFLWLFVHAALILQEQLGLSSIWFVFLAKIFGTFLVARVFLHMVHRALPDGSIRILMERSTLVLIWGMVLLDYIGKLDAWIAVLDGFQIKLGKTTVTAFDVVTLVFVVVVVYLLVKWLSSEVERFLINKPNKYFSEIDLSSRVVMTRILKGLLAIVGVLFSLASVGLDLTVLSVFGGALGVGIGLGLQKIASNYVSGFVMLFERSVRIGDLVTTHEGHRGNVAKINARYTVINGVEGNEILVPNESLVTQAVTNWSLQDSRIWMSSTIQVSLETDIDLIRPQLLAAVQEIKRVLSTPEPVINLSRITEKGMILEISWWIEDPQNGRGNVSSEVNLATWRVCRANGVEFFTLEPVKAPSTETQTT